MAKGALSRDSGPEMFSPRFLRQAVGGRQGCRLLMVIPVPSQETWPHRLMSQRISR